MRYTAEEKKKMAEIVVQINDYLDKERAKLREKVRVKIPNTDDLSIMLVIPPYSERYSTESILIIGCATYYFNRKDEDDWLHCLQCRTENAAYIINYWSEIKTKLQLEIINQNEKIKNINEFRI